MHLPCSDGRGHRGGKSRNESRNSRSDGESDSERCGSDDRDSEVIRSANDINDECRGHGKHPT